MRGPESSLITWSSYKAIIRVLQLVLLCVPVSIGWHHCRDTACDRPTKLEHSHVTHSHWLVTQSVTSNKYHPGRGSGSQSVVWVLCEIVRVWGWVVHLPALAVQSTAGSSPYWESPPVARARPHTFHTVYCLGDSPTPPGGLERPVIRVTRAPCIKNL